MPTPDIRRIPLDLLKPTTHNPRRIRPDDPKLAELAASIRAHSQLQPGIARPHPGQPGVFELLAGARRWWGCQLAGLTDMLVSVVDLDDRAAIEVTVLENLQRDELSPLEEADGIRMLVKSGASAKEIAEKIGKDWAWVVRRGRLAELSPAWQSELAKPESYYSHFTAAHLELIARYDQALQDRLLEDLRKSLYRLPRSVKQLSNELAVYQAKLAKVPWSLDDAGLCQKAGACSTCPKRASRSPGLFGDEIGVEAKDDQCLDVKCFAKKMRAHIEQRAEDLRKEHPDLVFIKRGYGERGLPGSLNEYDVEKARSGQKGARPALVTAGPGKGTLTWVKLTKQAQADHAADPEADKKAQAEKEAQDRAMEVRRSLANRLEKAERPATFDERAAIAVLLQPSYLLLNNMPTVRKTQRIASADLLAMVWKSLRSSLCSQLRDKWNHCGKPANLKAVADLFGVTLDATTKKTPPSNPAKSKKVSKN